MITISSLIFVSQVFWLSRYRTSLYHIKSKFQCSPFLGVEKLVIIAWAPEYIDYQYLRNFSEASRGYMEDVQSIFQT